MLASFGEVSAMEEERVATSLPAPEGSMDPKWMPIASHELLSISSIPPDGVCTEESLNSRRQDGSSASLANGISQSPCPTGGNSCTTNSIYYPPVISAVLPYPTVGSYHVPYPTASSSSSLQDSMDVKAHLRQPPAPPPASKGRPLSNTNLFVCNLPLTVDEPQLESLFSPYGAILSYAVMRDIHTGSSLGTAFVRFSTHDEAKRAMDGLDGSVVNAQGSPNNKGEVPSGKSANGGHERMVVQWARREHDRCPTRDDRKKMRKVFVRNIPTDVTEAHLASLFGKFGPLLSISLHEDTMAAAAAAAHHPASRSPSNESLSSLLQAPGRRRIAFVTYAVGEVAEQAATAVHHTMPFESCDGVPLMVKLAEDSPVRHLHQHALTQPAAFRPARASSESLSNYLSPTSDRSAPLLPGDAGGAAGEMSLISIDPNGSKAGFVHAIPQAPNLYPAAGVYPPHPAPTAPSMMMQDGTNNTTLLIPLPPPANGAGGPTLFTQAPTAEMNARRRDFNPANGAAIYTNPAAGAAGSSYLMNASPLGAENPHAYRMHSNTTASNTFGMPMIFPAYPNTANYGNGAAVLLTPPQATASSSASSTSLALLNSPMALSAVVSGSQNGPAFSSNTSPANSIASLAHPLPLRTTHLSMASSSHMYTAPLCYQTDAMRAGAHSGLTSPTALAMAAQPPQQQSQAGRAAPMLLPPSSTTVINPGNHPTQTAGAVQYYLPQQQGRY